MSSNQNNGKPGNSGFIARKLAAALGSFCEIDESVIRSRLLNPKKSKISLKDLRLKPFPIKEDCDQAILITGHIEEAIFRWKWNLKGKFKKSSLLIKGVKIRLQPISAQEVAEMHARERLSASSFDSTKSLNDISPEKDLEKAPEKKTSKFVKDIIDQLLLNIEDLEVHLELPTAPGEPLTNSKKTVVINGKYIELESMGALNTANFQHKARTRKRKKDLKKNNRENPLLQHLRIGSLSAHVIDIDGIDGSRMVLPFIDPIQYTIVVKRFHGERFGGFGEGLDVKGEVLPVAGRTSVVPIESFSEDERDDPDSSLMSSGGEVEIYADDEEVETRLSLVISNSWDEDKAYSYLSCESRDLDDIDPPINDGVKLHLGSVQTVALFSIIKLFAIKPNTLESEEKEKSRQLSSLIGPGSLGMMRTSKDFFRSSKDLNKSSVYNLPFDKIQVVLPNRAIVVARECAFQLQADGTKCIIEGSGGVHVDGTEVLIPGSSWTVDIIEEDILLQPREIPIQSFMSDRKLNFEVGLSSITSLAVGIGELVKLKKMVMARSPSSPNVGNARQSNWSLKLNGTTDIKF